MSFKDKVVVITGAGRGLGYSMARRFGQEEAHAIIAEIDPALGEQAVVSLRAEGVSAAYEPLDMCNPAQSTALVEKMVQLYGHIDVWINNASTANASLIPAELLPVQKWDESIALMLSGVFYCSQAVGRQMLAQGYGVLINMTTVGGYQYVEGRVANSVSEAGLTALTQALGIEWAVRGVRVVGIASGMLVAGMAQKYVDEASGRLEAYQHRTPMRRLGTMEEIVEAVIFLASEQASYIVGEVMRVDGGWAAYQMF